MLTYYKYDEPSKTFQYISNEYAPLAFVPKGIIKEMVIALALV